MPRRGFTLIEILIVVLILGILAAIVIPQFSSATSDARGSGAAASLRELRQQIQVFQVDHNNIPPQSTGMWAVMTSKTDRAETATASPAGTTFGPYLKAPAQNPWNNLTAATSAAVDPSAGWYYTATTTSFTIQIRNSDGSINTAY